jgi:CIC family chloride channel protein
MAAGYSLLPALMITSAASYAVASIGLSGSTIFTFQLLRRGVTLDGGEALLERVLVRDAMAWKVVALGPETTVREAMARIFEENVRGFPVVEGGRLAGIVTFDDLRRVPEGKQDEVRVGEVAVKDVIVAFPDENMKNVMDRLYRNNVGRLPVVERDDPKKLVGIVTRTDAIAAYQVLSREEAGRER